MATLVTLRCGSELPEKLVNETMEKLHPLDKISLSQLVDRCEDPGGKLTAQATKILKRSGLISDDGSVPVDIRQVVLSATEGHGIRTWLSSPVDDAEPKNLDVAMSDTKLYEAARRIADMTLEYLSSQPETRQRLESKPKDSTLLNPYFYQTKQGLFLEVHSCFLGNLWTPWGCWSFWSGSSVNVSRELSTILSRLGAEEYRPETDPGWGCEGPIYRILKLDGLQLPWPLKRFSGFLSYQDCKARWDDLAKQYQSST